MHKTETAEYKQTRRQVLKTAAGVGFLLALPMVRATSAGADQWTPAGKADQFVKGQPQRVDLQGYPFFITRTSPTSLTAIWAKCTHRGCTVAWHPDATQFICPCHGAAFDTDGTNIHGPQNNQPAKLPRLAAMPVREKDGVVEINLAPQS